MKLMRKHGDSGCMSPAWTQADHRKTPARRQGPRPARDFTDLLQGLPGRQDDPGLLPRVHVQLRQIAGALFKRERRNQTLQPTALVNEAGIRLSARRRRPWRSERHFLGAAAKAMRRILVEHARSRNALKRGGSLTRVDLNEVTLRERESPIDVLDLHEALDRLQAIDKRKARLVELRFFGGLTINETAESLGLCASTVKQEWAVARAWLKRELSGDE